MEHILSPLDYGFVFGAGRILFAGRTRTGRRHSKMGFYVIVPRKARHDSTEIPFLRSTPQLLRWIASLFLGRAVFAYRPDVDKERWMANKRTDVLVLVCLTKPLATIYNFKYIS